MANFFEQYIRQDQNDESDPFAKYDGADSMQPDDAEDEDPFAKYDAPEPVRDTSNTTEYSNPIARGFSAGVDQLQGMGGGAAALVGDLVGSDTVRDWGIDVYQQNMAEAAVNQNKQPFTEIDSVTDALGWAGYTLGNLAPMVAPSLLTGGAGGLIAKQGTQALAKRLVAEQVAKGVSQKQAAKIAGTEVAKRIAAGSTAGAGAASVGMSSGEIYGDTEDAGVSLTHGIVAGAVDALPVMRVLDKFGLGKTAGDAVKKNVLAEAGKQSLFEGGTEAFQTLVEQHAKHWVDNNGESLLANLGEVKWDEVLEASAAGALGGAVMGAPSQMFENSRIGQQDRQKEARRNRAAKIEAAKQAARDKGGDELDVELAGANTALDIESTDIESYISGDPIAEDRDTRGDIAPVTTFGPQTGGNGLLSGAATMPQDYPAWQPSQPTQPVIDPIANEQAPAPLEIAAKGEYPVASADQLTQLSGIDAPTDQYREQPDAANKYTAGSLVDASSERSEQSAATTKNAFEDTFAAASQEPNTQIPDTQRPTEDNKADEAAPQLDDSIAIEPVTIWTGRKGDGYDTAEDAQKAISSRAKTNPELQWQAEQMPSGKYRLAGYQQSESNDVQQGSDSMPEAQITESADQPVSEQPALDLPEILATPRKQYINRMAKEAGIKKDSPGYKNAIADIESQYEQEAEQALGNVSFEQYQSLNQDQPESVNRQAHAALVEEYGSHSNLLESEAQTDLPRTDAMQPTVKSDGTPFGSERMALASARQKKIANPVAVQVGEGWGYTEAANVPDGRAGRDSNVPVEQTNIETGRTGVVGSDDGVSSSVGRTGEADAGSVDNATGSDGVAVEGDALELRGDAIDDEWTGFAADSGTLNIPRDEMPQVKAEHRGALANFLKGRGITGTDETVPASSLKPTQKEFSEAKVQKAKEFEGGDRAILVSADGHVLDGHHQWMAKRDNGEDVRVIKLDAPISTLLNQIKEFPSVEQSSGPPSTVQTTTEGAQQAPLSMPGGKRVGEITENLSTSIRRQAAPIVLEDGDTNFGRQHIEERRGDILRENGYTVDEFVEEVAAGFNQIYRASGGQLVLAKVNGKDKIAFVKLSPSENGDYYRVNSALIVEKRHIKKHVKDNNYEMLWDGVEPPSETSSESPTFAHLSESKLEQKEPNVLGHSNDNNALDNPASQPTLSKSGKPFRGKGTAILAAKKAGIANPQAVEVDGGWGYVAPTVSEAEAGSVSEAPESTASQEAKVTDAEGSSESTTESKADNQEAKATEEKSATNQKIEDFGETLHGARKHTALKYVETMEDESIDVAAEPLTKSFPAPNYKKMASDGVDKKSLATIAVLRDLIPPKPRKSWKAKRWAEDVSKKRQLAKDLIEQGKDFNQSWRLIDELSEYDVVATAEAIKDLPAEDFPKAAKYKIATGEFSLADGVQYNPPKQLWYIKGPNGRRVNASILDNISSIGDYKESEADAIAAAKELIPKMIGKADGQKTRSKYTEVNVYRDRTTGDRFLAFKARSSVIRLKGGFESLTEARDYLQENRDEIQDKIDSMRRGPNMRGTENKPRQGDNLREGDITPESFSDAFNFRGVQFGNYVEGARRQADLNRAYDALMDLADAVGVPPKALSLNGSLGLAFGARGKGGRNSAAAHYEPGTVVINLTKNAGPGSLSHEWLHALDNYFGEQDNTGDFITRTKESGGGTRQEVFDAWKKVEAAISSGEFTNRSAEFDKARSKPYFNTTIEKAARAFERYTIDRLDEKGVTNDYLANIDMEGGAYPTSGEMQQDGIREAFDTLFDTIESKETDQGVMLYSRQSTLADNAKPKGVGKGTAQLAVNRFMNQYKGADDVKVVIAENYEEAFGSPAEFRTKGGYDPKTDTLYLFTGELDSVTDLNETLRHEILVHKGLGMVEPARIKQFLDSFYEAAKDSRELTQIVGEVERVESKRSDRLKAEEILARIAQEKPSLTDKIWNRIVLAVQRMLNRHGLWDVSAKRRGKDVVYRIGDAFAEGKRAAKRVDLDSSTEFAYSRKDADTFWNGWKSNVQGKSEADAKEWLRENYTLGFENTRGSVANIGGRIGSGREWLSFDQPIAGFDKYVTVADPYPQDNGGDVFSLKVIPLNLLKNRNKSDTAILDVTLTDKGDNTFELGVLGPREGTAAYDALKDSEYLEDTGRTTDNGDTYHRLKIGTAMTKALLSEAVRRLTIHNGKAPDAVEYSRRDTGARAGDANSRSFDQDTIETYFSRDDGPESPAWKAAKAKGLDMSKEARMQRARDMGFDTDTVYYHGTKSSSEVDSLRASQDGMLGKGVYITDDIGKAEKYAGMGMQYSDGGSVYPLYIKDGEIWDVADKGFPRDELQGTNDDLVDELSSRGFIGIKDGKETVLFDPANIRSVNAAFDPDEAASPNLMLSRTDDTFTPPVEERMSDKFLRNVQDKFRPLKRLQDAIKKSGGTVNDATDTYMAEEAFYGKTENDLKKLERRLIEPLVASMTENDISREELDLFLVANHAEERNAYIATINPDMPDGGSGMTNAAAEAVMAKFSKDGKLDAVKAVADHVYKITETRRRILEDAGLVDADYMAQFETPYENYVPLKGFAENESEGRAKVGRGFDIRGKEDLRAMGRRTMAESPTLHAIQDMTASAIRLRKNEVGQTFLRMVEANPNPDYWEVFDSENPDTRRTMVNGVVTKQPITNMGMLKDDYFAVKKGGKEYFIKVKDKRVQNALQNIGPEQMNVFMRSMGKVTRFLSAVNTSYNPEFMISNVSRDIQTAVYNALAEENITDGKIKGTGKAIAARMVKNVPKSARAIWIEQGKGVDESAEDITEYRRYYREFLADGAKTGYFDSKDIDGLTKELSARLSMANGGVVGGARKTKKAIGDFVERMNSSIENAVRLSGYIEARKAGVSRKKAASFAKSMTVNFNRRGELGANLNAVYLFFNASAQGTANFARAIGTIESSEYGRALSNGYTGKRLNTAQKAAGVMMAGAFALSALNREMAGDDDDGENWYDKVPEHVRERNIVIMKSIWGGPEGEYTTIPLPYGYNIFYNLGDAAEAAINSKSKKRKEGLALGLGLSAFGSFSPIGAHKGDNAASALGLTFTPTVMLPVAEIATNTNFFGSNIYRENYEFGPEKSDAVLSMRSTKQMYKNIAEFVNEVTGGSTYESGAIDISPDTLEHLAEFGLGGMYRLVDRGIETVDALTDGRELETRNIPFYRKVSGEVQPYADIADFYDARQEIENLKAESELLKGRERIDFIRENKDQLRLKGLMDSTYGKLRNLNKRRDRIEEDESLTDAQRDERLRAIETMKKREVDRFNKRWNAAA